MRNERRNEMRNENKDIKKGNRPIEKNDRKKACTKLKKIRKIVPIYENFEK